MPSTIIHSAFRLCASHSTLQVERWHRGMISNNVNLERLFRTHQAILSEALWRAEAYLAVAAGSCSGTKLQTC